MKPVRHFVDTQDFDKAELLTIMELIASLGMLFEELQITFIGDATNVCNSLAATCRACSGGATGS